MLFRRIAAASGAGVRAFGRALPALLRDLAGLAGIGLVAYGAWMIHPPAGFITGGIMLVVGAYLLGAKAASGQDA